jgi:hypothetical protein
MSDLRRLRYPKFCSLRQH